MSTSKPGLTMTTGENRLTHEESTSLLGPARRLNIGLFLKIATSVVILGVVFWKFRSDIPSLYQVSPLSVIAAISLLLLQPPLMGLRWWLVLRMYGSRAPLGTAVAIAWVAGFASQFLPASVGGDAIRVYYVRTHCHGLGAAIASVLIDRLVALVALALLTVVFGVALADTIDQRLIAGVGILTAFGLVAAIVVFRIAGKAEKLSSRWRVLERLVHLIQYVLRIVSHPLRGAASLAIAILIHMLSFTALLLIARGMGVQIGVVPFMAVSALLIFIQVMPISIGGWGVREAAAVTLFGLIGIAAGPALLVSIVFGLSAAAASLPGAAIWPYLKFRPNGPVS